MALVWSLAAVAFVMALNANVMGPLYPFLGPELQIDEESMGYLLAAPNVTAALAALVVGPLSDRSGWRGPLLFGLAGFVVASGLHLLPLPYPLLLALRAVTGFVAGLAFTCASTAVTELVPYFRLGKASGVFSSGLFFAIALGLPVASGLAAAGHWRAIFAIQCVCGAGALFACLAMPRARKESGGRKPSIATVLAQPAVFPTLVAVMLAVGAFFSIVQFSGRWLDAENLVPKADQKWLWSALGGCSAVGSLVITPLADRIGKRNFVLVSAVVMMGLLVMLARVHTFGALVWTGVPLALVGAARTGATQALVSQLVPMHLRGTLMGVRSSAVTIGMALCSLAGGWVVEARGYPYWLWCAAGITLASYLLIRFSVSRDL